jgi:hypothetical protein
MPNIWLRNLQVENGIDNTTNCDFFHYLGILSAKNF